MYAGLAACTVGHDRGVNGQNDRRNWGRRLGVELGLVNPPHGPRPQLPRILAVGPDSSHGELIAALVRSGLLIAVLAINAFSDSLWLRLIWPFLALVLLVNPVRAVRLLVQQHRAGPGRPPTT